MKPTVLNIGQHYHIRGGSDRYLFALQSLLESYGHRVVPFAARNPGNIHTEWDEYFPVASDFDNPGPRDLMRFIYSWPAKRAMERLLDTIEIDIAHLHIYYGKLTTSILEPLVRRGIPIVQTLHDFKLVCPVYSLLSHGEPCDSCEGRKYWHAVFRRCNRGSLARSSLSAMESYFSRWNGAWDKVDRFIAVSDFVRDTVVGLGIPSDKVTTVHNFVDCAGKVPGKAGADYFLYFGRIERDKGIFTLLEAAARVPDIPLVIAGTGNAQKEVEAWIDGRAAKHITFVGHQQGEALGNLIGNALCTVNPSHSQETFGLTLVESFAYGRPVIASRVGGMTEVVAEGTDGILVSAGDVDELVDALIWATENRGAMEAMGRAGRAKAELQFSPSAHYASIMEVYRRVSGTAAGA